MIYVFPILAVLSLLCIVAWIVYEEWKAPWGDDK